jgi:SAM-dependent methyltransferase/uncharacterized protein YbaR (Trm112 family)
MHSKFIDFFFDPIGNERLNLYSFKKENENILSAIFVNKKSGMAYPVYNGVPVFLSNSFPLEFIKQFSNEIQKVKNEIPNLVIQKSINKNDWSFSLEWEAHSKLNMTTTWGMSLESRYEQFLYETQSLDENLNDKLLLDAGCGNGLLTEYFSKKGLISIGIDFSTSVFDAEKRRTSDNCCFVQGDLMSPPFRNDTFDIIVSNGVLHHTPRTEITFKTVANKVKKNGKLYLWLYSRKGTIFWRFKRRVFDYLRIVICRMPPFGKKVSVKAIAFFLYSVYLMLGKKLDKNTLIIDIYDSVTPRWRHYHTPEEISRWFYEAGFGPVSITYWDTKYGFGSMALKKKMLNTPGEHFERN